MWQKKSAPASVTAWSPSQLALAVHPSPPLATMSPLVAVSGSSMVDVKGTTTTSALEMSAKTFVVSGLLLVIVVYEAQPLIDWSCSKTPLHYYNAYTVWI